MQDTPRSPARGWLRGRDWERITRGVYAAGLNRTELEELAAWQLVVPRTAAFTHLTVARLRGWWLPATIPHPVFAAMLNDDPRPRRPGWLICRHTQPFAMNLVNGLRITTAGETILAAARDLGVLDLVILGDSALRLRHCTLTDLEITARQRRRGAPLLRRVIPLLDARSESPWESIMRVLHQAAEIPVTPQQDIFDERGRFIARADLRIDGTRRIHEYDGERHRDPEVHELDLERDRALLADRWERHVSLQSTCDETALQSSPTLIACLDVLGARVDSLRGRACSTTRSWDGLVAPAPTATGGEPLLKPVSCNKEMAAI